MENKKLSVADTFEGSCDKYPTKTAIHFVNTNTALTFKQVDQGGRQLPRAAPPPRIHTQRLCPPTHTSVHILHSVLGSHTGDGTVVPPSLGLAA